MTKKGQAVSPDPQDPTAAPAIPPAPPVMPPSGHIQAVEGDKIDWQRKYSGQRGAYIQLQQQHDEWVGRVNEQVKGFQAQINLLQKEHDAATQLAGTLGKQVEGFSATEERAKQAGQFEASNERLRSLMNYPEIVSNVKVETVKDEEGNEQQVRKNSLVELVLSSNKVGDELIGLLDGLSEQLASSSGAGERAVAAGATMLPTPAPTETMDSLRDKALAAQTEGNYEEANRLWGEFAEARMKGDVS